MKKIILLVCMLWGIAQAQTIGSFRYDSTRLEKVGGNNELILLNSTRNVAGYLYNKGNGRTEFRAISGIGVDTLYRRGDSVFMVKSGTERFAFTDSVGTGGSGSASNDSIQTAYGRLFNSLNILGEDTLFVVGDSFSASYGVSGSEGWNAIFSQRYGMVNLSYALSSSGVWNAAKEANNRYVTPDMTRTIAVMVGLNDIRRSVATGTYKKLASGIRSIAANNLVNVFTPASAPTASSGTWTAQDMNAWGGKAGALTSGTGVYNNVSGSYLEFNATGSAFIIGYMSRVTSGFTGGVFNISVDGTVIATVTADQTDGVSDGVNNNEIMPGAYLLKGLTPGVHNIRITNTSNNYVYIDYFATAKQPVAVSPILVSFIPKLTQSGYAISPNAASDAAFNMADDSIANAVKMFEGWPITLVPVNSYYDVTKDVQADSIHPNRQGYRHLADAFSTSVKKKDIPTAGPGIANGGITNTIQALDGSKRFNAGMQILGALTSPTGGGSMELEYNAGTSYLTSLNRTGTVYQPVVIRGSTLTFNSAGVGYATMATTGIFTFERGMIINNGGAANNTQIKTDTDDNAIFANGTTNNVGIGTAVPSAKLEVNGNVKINTVANVSVADSVLYIEDGIIKKGAAAAGITNLAPVVASVSSATTITEPSDNREKTYVADATSGTLAFSAAVSPTNGQIIVIFKSDASANAVTITTIEGAQSVTTQNGGWRLQYITALSGYKIISSF